MATGIIYALVGGILPALIWLTFWLHEDRKAPEPKRLIAKTFLFGMLAVILVIPLQKGLGMWLPDHSFLLIFLWAALEEGFKLLAGYFGGLHSRDDNEPLDALVYMITAALGFVALENTLFILSPILGGDMVETVLTGNLRFIGASLLHTVSSGLVGACLAFRFYASQARQVAAALIGLLLALGFHTLFNMLIISYDTTGLFGALALVWSGTITLLWVFERAKSIAPLS